MTIRDDRRSASTGTPGLFLAALLVLLGIGGCSTPQPVRDLAAQGAVMADKAQGEAGAFIERSTHAYQRREAILRGLAEGEIRDVAAGDFRAWIASQAGVSSDQTRIALITKIADQSRASREQAEAALAAKTKQLADAAGTQVKVPAKSLGEAKKAFLNLAQELTPEEWLKFSWNYVSQLQADLKALKDQPGKDASPD